MRVAIYVRVSTANNGQDPEMQLRELGSSARRDSGRLSVSTLIPRLVRRIRGPSSTN
jgi:hypothetical protein